MTPFVCRNGSPPIWTSADSHTAICIDDAPLHRDPGEIEVSVWSIWSSKHANGQTMVLPVAALPALTDALARIERARSE